MKPLEVGGFQRYTVSDHDGGAFSDVVPRLPNPLTAGAYSRRINIQQRIVYEVFAQEKTVRVLRMWTHYE